MVSNWLPRSLVNQADVDASYGGGQFADLVIAGQLFRAPEINELEGDEWSDRVLILSQNR